MIPHHFSGEKYFTARRLPSESRSRRLLISGTTLPSILGTPLLQAVCYVTRLSFRPLVRVVSARERPSADTQAARNAGWGRTERNGRRAKARSREGRARRLLASPVTTQHFATLRRVLLSRERRPSCRTVTVRFTPIKRGPVNGEDAIIRERVVSQPFIHTWGDLHERVSRSKSL